MSPRRRRRAGALLLAVGAWFLVAGGPAVAADGATVDDIGWWARVNQDPTLAGVTPRPDVVPGQLLVEGMSGGATAIAAIRVTLPEGQANPVLTLDTASDAGGEAAVLLACQTGSGWTGAHAGSWDAKPSPDCASSVQGIRADDGSSWTFALGPLQFGNQLDVVLVPGVDPSLPDGANGSTFRIVFERPTVANIETTDGGGTADPAFDAPAVTFAPEPSAPSGPAAASAPSGASSFDPAPSSFGDAGSGSSFSIPVPPSEEELAAQPAQASLPASEQGLTATAPVVAAESPLGAGVPVADGTDAGRAVGALVVLIGGGLLLWSTTQELPQRQLLSRFAVAGASGTTATPVSPAADKVVQTGGLGRFRRERATPARRLGG